MKNFRKFAPVQTDKKAAFFCLKTTFTKPLSCLLGILILCSSPVPVTAYDPTHEEIALLQKIQKDTFQYFVRLSDKTTGLTKDSSQPGSPASIAATGFSLAAFAIAGERGWVEKEYARDYIHKTLKTVLEKAAHKNGFFYHFIDTRSAKRVWSSEASSIDTALLVAGALLAATYYPGTNIESMAHEIYNRIDWPWMMNKTDLICMGWRPEEGFLPYYWDSYNELLILQVLALGSPTHPIPPDAWDAWDRWEDEYKGHKVVYAHSGSLFTYQYSHAFIDFRNLDDAGINYFDNSIAATLANKAFSDEFSRYYKSYSKYSWGLSASVGPGGYKAYGALPGQGAHDGTIAPYGAIGSIFFTPEESIRAIEFFYKRFGKRVYGGYGFKGAFNLDKNWWAQEYLGIDQGISVLMLENYLYSGNLWQRFMKLATVKKWIEVAEIKVT